MGALWRPVLKHLLIWVQAPLARGASEAQMEGTKVTQVQVREGVHTPHPRIFKFLSF